MVEEALLKKGENVNWMMNGKVKITLRNDELYRSLLPIYNKHMDDVRTRGGEYYLYDTFIKLWDFGQGGLSAGEAMEMALDTYGLLPYASVKKGLTMESASREYDEIMEAEDLIRGGQG